LQSNASALCSTHRSSRALQAIGGERGYQTLINDTLRRAVEGEYFVQEMRNAIREELVEYAIEIKRGKS